MKETQDFTAQDFIMKPKVDFCFKELMNDAEIRKGFIAALLNLSPEEIVRTELLPTHLRKKHEEDKLGILDVRVLLDKSVQMDIEIQISPFKLWQERSLFYLSKMYTDQIEMGEDYDVLEKCIHVGILDFTLFESDKEYYSRFHIWEDSRCRMYSDKMEIHILELPKLSEYNYPDNELLNWARFINAEKKKEMEIMSKKSPYIEKAYEKLVNISADEQKRLEYEAREKAIRDHNYLVNSNRREGRKEGRTESILELLEELGNVPEVIKQKITDESDLSILSKWLKLAAKADSIEMFVQEMDAHKK